MEVEERNGGKRERSKIRKITEAEQERVVGKKGIKRKRGRRMKTRII
jgi:hypothetical protein